MFYMRQAVEWRLYVKEGNFFGDKERYLIMRCTKTLRVFSLLLIPMNDEGFMSCDSVQETCSWADGWHRSSVSLVVAISRKI